MLSQVRVSGTVVQPVLEQGAEGLKLDDYMRLPVAQYASLEMPFEASLEREALVQLALKVVVRTK